MIELERTYLAKKLPENLLQYKSKEIIDVYFPKSQFHPKIRLRKNGDRYELTKKTPVDNDVSKLKEETIILTEEEFNEFNNNLRGKRVHKIRYYFDYEGRIAEFDIFQGELRGLILIDFEFNSTEEKKKFTIPSFCLAEVTSEDFIAGGIICGKSYNDIKKNLERFNYKKI